MKISITHQRFADYLYNQRALDHPEEFLGQNWKDVLNFWIFLDTLNDDQWNSIHQHYRDLDRGVKSNYYTICRNNAREATNNFIIETIDYSTCYFSTEDATYELIGSHILQEQGKSLVFLQLFLNV